MTFLAFAVGTCVLYFLVPHRVRWVLLLGISYYFYASWMAEYLLVLVGVTLLNYVAAFQVERARSQRVRMMYLALSIIGTLGMLLAYKYLGFFVGSTNRLFSLLGWAQPFSVLHVLQPIGISFFTLQSLGYTIDVYKGTRATERHLGIFALYVSFFPQLLAGPIGRSTQLLPQFFKKQQFDPSRAASGLRLILWGFFKKMVIADRLAIGVATVYNNPSAFTGLPLVIATYAFAIQLLCDFSAYTDIARGVARILGYELAVNFRQPYFSESIREFWRRWHISLTSWFRDYLYIPLGGNRATKLVWYRNVAIVFLVSGLWHGAGLTFVVWGAVHAAFMLLGIWSSGLRDWFTRSSGLVKLPTLHRFIRMAVTFNLVAAAWVFFRARSVSEAWYILTHLITGIRLTLHQGLGLGMGTYATAIASLAISVFVAVDALQEKGLFLAAHAALPVWVRFVAYYSLAMAVILIGKLSAEPFIYGRF